MALNLPNIAPANPWSDVTDVRNHLTNQALNEQKAALFNQYYGPQKESEIAQHNALTKGYDIANQYAPDRLDLQNQLSRENLNQLKKTNPLAYEKLQIENQYLPREKQAGLEQKQAQTEYYRQGGPGMGVPQKARVSYQNSVALDNPHLPPDQVREAANILAQGGNQLPDGTKLNPLSFDSKQALDNAIKYGTTSGLITSGVQANAGEAELSVLNKYALDGMNLAGPTYFGQSPSIIAAQFSKSDADQEKLGKIIAGNALQYAIAQIRNRIDMGQPGITATHEIMQNSGQVLNSLPGLIRLTPKARESAMKTISQATSEALKARNEYGIGASGAAGKNKANQSEKVDLVTVLIPGGKKIQLPSEGANRLIKDHPDHKIVR